MSGREEGEAVSRAHRVPEWADTDWRLDQRQRVGSRWSPPTAKEPYSAWARNSVSTTGSTASTRPTCDPANRCKTQSTTSHSRAGVSSVAAPRVALFAFLERPHDG